MKRKSRHYSGRQYWCKPKTVCIAQCSKSLKIRTRSPSSPAELQSRQRLPPLWLRCFQQFGLIARLGYRRRPLKLLKYYYFSKFNSKGGGTPWDRNSHRRFRIKIGCLSTLESKPRSLKFVLLGRMCSRLSWISRRSRIYCILKYNWKMSTLANGVIGVVGLRAIGCAASVVKRLVFGAASCGD